MSTIGRATMALVAALATVLLSCLRVLSVLSQRRDGGPVYIAPLMETRVQRPRRQLSQRALIVVGGATLALLASAVGVALSSHGLGPLHLDLPRLGHRLGPVVAYILAATVLAGSVLVARAQGR